MVCHIVSLSTFTIYDYQKNPCKILHEDKKAIRRLMDMLIARDKAYRMHERQKEYNYRSYMGCKLCKQFFQKKRIKRLMTRKSKQINRK